MKYYIFAILELLLGPNAMFNFFSTVLGYSSYESYNILTFETSKTGYLIFKFLVGAILIIFGIREFKKPKKNNEIPNKH